MMPSRSVSLFSLMMKRSTCCNLPENRHGFRPFVELLPLSADVEDHGMDGNSLLRAEFYIPTAFLTAPLQRGRKQSAEQSKTRTALQYRRYGKALAMISQRTHQESTSGVIALAPAASSHPKASSCFVATLCLSPHCSRAVPTL